MRGFNPGAVIPKRNLKDVRPMRFNLIVKIHPEVEESEFIIMPDSVKKARDATRGGFGTIAAVGEAIPKMKKMLGDRVLVRKPKKEDFKVTKSKLWVPAGHQKQEVGGVVIAVGPGLYNPERERYLPMGFKAGDFVLFPKYGGTDIKIDGHDHVVVRQDKVLAIVEGETERLQFA